MCGKNRLPEKNAVCPTGDAVRYEPYRCKRVGCPDCYQSEDRERPFEMVRELEGVARVRGERPHAVAFGPPKTEVSAYSIENINTSLFRRGYRRMKRKCEIERGHGVLHPARIPDDIKERLIVITASLYRRGDSCRRSERLRRRFSTPSVELFAVITMKGVGYGPDGDRGGYWAGVRDDALNLGDWREYAYYSPHGHSIGFPGWIEPHEGEDFIVHKYDMLEDAESLMAHVRYLLSHRGVYAGDGRIQAVRPWEEMHHAADGWNGAEEELSEDEYESLSREIADIVGMDWSPEEGLYRDESDECPECGTPKEHFIGLWDLPTVARESWQGGQEWLRGLSDSQRRFILEIIDILYSAQQPVIYQEDLRHPDDISVMVDGNRPPPAGES